MTTSHLKNDWVIESYIYKDNVNFYIICNRCRNEMDADIQCLVCKEYVPKYYLNMLKFFNKLMKI